MIDSIPYIIADSNVATEAEHQCIGLTLDSLFPHRDIAPETLRESLLNGHGYAACNNGLIARTSPDVSVWILATVLAVSLLLFLYYRLRKISLADILRSVIDHRSMERIIRNSNLTPARLMPIALFVAAETAMAIHRYALSGAATLPILAIALALAYLLRNALFRLLGNVFEEKQAFGIYITNAYFYHLALATLIIPFLFLQIFVAQIAPAAFYTICGLVALCYTMRIARGLKLFLTFSKSFNFFLFYYLCIVESIPLLVLIKTFISL